MTGTPCPICQKHRGEGPLVGPVVVQDDLLAVSHRATGPLGYLFIETRRHAPYLHDLTDAEALAVGRARARLARGLKDLLNAELVHTAVAGRGVPHFHEHVFVRHPGTPSSYAWHEAHDWPGATYGDAAALCARLRSYLDR